MVYRALLLDDGISLPVKAIWENLVHNAVLKPVRRLCAPPIDGYLIRWWCTFINVAHSTKMFHIIAVEDGSLFGRNDEVIPEQTAVTRHLGHRLVILCLDTFFICGL